MPAPSVQQTEEQRTAAAQIGLYAGPEGGGTQKEVFMFVKAANGSTKSVGPKVCGVLHLLAAV